MNSARCEVAGRKQWAGSPSGDVLFRKSGVPQRVGALQGIGIFPLARCSLPLRDEYPWRNEGI